MGAHQVSCQDGILILMSTVLVIVAGGGINARILNGFLYIKSSTYPSGALEYTTTISTMNFLNFVLLGLSCVSVAVARPVADIEKRSYTDARMTYYEVGL